MIGRGRAFFDRNDFSGENGARTDFQREVELVHDPFAFGVQS
jgi:hypothetical protein